MTNKPSGLDGTAAMGHAWCGGLPYQHYYSLSSGLRGLQDPQQTSALNSLSL